MRFASVVLGWLIATLALAVAVPAGWVQLHVVDADGYAALARRAAADPALQSAMAAELTTRAMALIAEHGGGRYPVDGTQVHDAAAAFSCSTSPARAATSGRSMWPRCSTTPRSGRCCAGTTSRSRRN